MAKLAAIRSAQPQGIGLKIVVVTVAHALSIANEIHFDTAECSDSEDIKRE